MLYVSDNRAFYRILAIDPGTSTIGISILDLDLLTYDINLVWSDTYVSDHTLRYYNDYVTNFETLDVKLEIIKDLLVDIMAEWDVDDVVSESPYMGRFPAAYGALTRCLDSIRRALQQYDYKLVLKLIDPATVKTNVGVSGKSGDKNAVKQAVLMLPLTNVGNVNLHALDEHSIDSIAVGYGYLEKMIR